MFCWTLPVWYHDNTANEGSQQTHTNLKGAFSGPPNTYIIPVPICVHQYNQPPQLRIFNSYSASHLYQTHPYQPANVVLLARWHVLHLLTQRPPIIRLQFRIFDAFLAPILMQFADVVLRLLEVE